MWPELCVSFSFATQPGTENPKHGKSITTTREAGNDLGLAMVGAIITHIRRGEYSHILPNIVLFAMALDVAYGRLLVEPF